MIAAFRQTRTHMEQLLPDLERVYTIERDWFNASFDPKAVATAELSAWIARRRPELSNEQYVGGLIAERDGLRYAVPPSMMAGPGLLEARAALILDSGQPDWAVIGATLRESYDDAPREQVAVLFGESLADALFEAEPGEWMGPYRSDFGLHLIRLRRRTDARLPPYDEIAERVAQEFGARRRREANEREYRKMRAKYDVVIERPEDSATTPGTAP